jgi:hypothetical protein
VALLFAALATVLCVDAGELDGRGLDAGNDDDAWLIQCFRRSIRLRDDVDSDTCDTLQQAIRRATVDCFGHANSRTGSTTHRRRRRYEAICTGTIATELKSSINSSLGQSNCDIEAKLVCDWPWGAEQRGLQEVVPPPIVVEGVDTSGIPVIIGSAVALAVTGAIATRYVYKRRSRQSSTYRPKDRSNPPARQPRRSPPTPNPMYKQFAAAPSAPSPMASAFPTPGLMPSASKQMVLAPGFSKPIPVYQPPGGSKPIPVYQPPVGAAPVAPARTTQVGGAARVPTVVARKKAEYDAQVKRLQEQQQRDLAALQAKQKEEEARILREYKATKDEQARKAAAEAQYKAAEAQRKQLSLAYKAARKQQEEAQRQYAKVAVGPPPGLAGVKGSVMTAEQKRQMNALKILQGTQQQQQVSRGRGPGGGIPTSRVGTRARGQVTAAAAPTPTPAPAAVAAPKPASGPKPRDPWLPLVN